MAADGSVVLEVVGNTSDAEEKISKLSQEIERSEGKQINFDINVSDAEKRLAELKHNIEQTEKEIENFAGDRASDSFRELKESLSDMLETWAEIADSSDEAFNIAMGRPASGVVQLKGDYYAGQAQEIEAQVAKAANGVNIVAETAAERISDLSRRLDELEQKKANLGLALGPKANAEYVELTRQIEETKNELVSLQAEFGATGDAAADAAEKAAGATKEVADGAKKAYGPLGKLTDRFKQIFQRRLWYVLIGALFQVGRKIFQMMKANKQFSASLARVKGALLTAFQPIYNVIVPALTSFLNLLAKVIAAIAALFSRLSGSTVKQSAEAAKSLNDEMNALEGVGSAAKNAGKQMASFDEINQIGDNGADGGGGAAGTIAPDFSGVISDTASMLLTSLGLLVIGAILTFTGSSVLLGIGMMALGAYGIYTEATENPGAVKEALNGWFGDVLVLAGMVAVVIGFILAFSGINLFLGIFLIAMGAAAIYTEASLAPDKMKDVLNSWLGEGTLTFTGIALIIIGLVAAFSTINIPLGIGLMVLGAAAIFTEATVNPDGMKAALNGWLGDAIVLVGMIALVIGAVLAFSSINIPLGIFLIAMGAAAIYTEASLAPDKMKDMLNGWLGDVLVIVGMIALVIGAVLAFSSINIPLGIFLIAMGAAAIYTEASLAPDKMKDMLNGWLGTALIIGGIIAIVLGVILICTVAGLPLGIALLVMGVGALVTGIVAKWDFILEKLKGIWSSVSGWWNTAVVPKLEAIGGFFVGCIINPLLSAVEGFINFFIRGLNFLISMINKISFETPDWIPLIGGKRFGFNLPTLSEVQLPRLAQGAVIPPNREFLAVLGDQNRGNNIEAPESLLRQIIRDEMGGNNQTAALLLAILNAVKEGQVIEVDRRAFGRVVHQANAEESRRVGINFAG